MPIQPQHIDTRAPIKKATAVKMPCSVRNVMMMNIKAAKMRQIRYSCLRNSLAPYGYHIGYFGNLLAELQQQQFLLLRDVLAETIIVASDPIGNVNALDQHVIEDGPEETQQTAHTDYDGLEREREGTYAATICSCVVDG